MVRPDARIACLFCFLLGCSGQGNEAFHTFEPVQQAPTESPDAASTTSAEPKQAEAAPAAETPASASKTEAMPSVTEPEMQTVKQPELTAKAADNKVADMVPATSPAPVPAAATTETSPPTEIMTPMGPLLSPLAMASPGASPPAQPATPAAPLPIKLLVPQKEFVGEGREKDLRVSFDDLDLLKVLNMEPVPPDAENYFPDWLKSLNGKRIILRGWMYPAGRADGISSFLFVRDNGICCFGRDPKVYDKLGVKLRSGVTTRYIQNRPFDVIGTLSIEPEIEGADERDWWLYFLNDAVVIEN